MYHPLETYVWRAVGGKGVKNSLTVWDLSRFRWPVAVYYWLSVASLVLDAIDSALA